MALSSVEAIYNGSIPQIGDDIAMQLKSDSTMSGSHPIYIRDDNGKREVYKTATEVQAQTEVAVAKIYALFGLQTPVQGMLLNHTGTNLQGEAYVVSDFVENMSGMNTIEPDSENPRLQCPKPAPFDDGSALLQIELARLYKLWQSKQSGEPFDTTQLEQMFESKLESKFSTPQLYQTFLDLVVGIICGDDDRLNGRINTQDKNPLSNILYGQGNEVMHLDFGGGGNCKPSSGNIKETFDSFTHDPMKLFDEKAPDVYKTKCHYLGEFMNLFINSTPEMLYFKENDSFNKIITLINNIFPDDNTIDKIFKDFAKPNGFDFSNFVKQQKPLAIQFVQYVRDIAMNSQGLKMLTEFIPNLDCKRKLFELYIEHGGNLGTLFLEYDNYLNSLKAIEV